jgi:hypothetical protein
MSLVTIISKLAISSSSRSLSEKMAQSAERWNQPSDSSIQFIAGMTAQPPAALGSASTLEIVGV